MAPTLAAPKPGEVHVWSADLDRQNGELALLSPDERERAARFLLELPRQRYTSARSLLRRLLGQYTGREPASLRFEYASAGKPRLGFATEIRFNASHSHGRLLVAVAVRREVGADIEQIREKVDWDAIARRFLPAGESEVADIEGFYRAWTRREAYLKARGCGLSGLQEPVRHGWTVQDLDAGPGWAAAVAAEGSSFEVRIGTYQR